MATAFGAVCVSNCGFESYHSRENRSMQHPFRVKRLHGYQTKKATVSFTRPSPRRFIWAEQRAELGLILGWSSPSSTRRVIYLRYTKEGHPSRTTLKFLSRPSRDCFVSSRSLWGSSGDHGVYLLQTTKGRLTHSQGRKRRLGGIASVWLS